MAGTLVDPGGEPEPGTSSGPGSPGASRTQVRAGAGRLLVTSLGHEQPGRYQLRRELARGGQGVVSVAWDAHLGREVAFKQLLHPTPRLADGELGEAEARFVREARITAQLDHPGIAPLHEVGLRADGTLYATQRLVKGQTLTVALAACTSLGDRLALLRPLLSVCHAVAFAHRRGVIHRDLKPDNVLVTGPGDAVVLDWGLGRTGEEAGTPDGDIAAVTSLIDDGADRTRQGTILGTPAYMSPEQASGDSLAVDARSDVWSLGVMLYQVLTGRRPFEGSTSQEVMQAAATQPLPPVRGRCPGVPEPLARLAERALRRRPEERPADAAALAAQLSASLPPLPGDQAPPGLATAPQPSVAVLPFADLSANHDQEYFSDGVTEEILTALSKVPGLRVPGRASSFYFKGKDAEPGEIARRLSVAHLLQGSVRQAGTTLRIAAELTREADGERLWRQTFDRELTDVFAVQEEIARAVVGALRIQLLPGQGPLVEERRPRTPEAHRLFLLGRYLDDRGTPSEREAAVRALEEAVRLDPEYLPAQVWLAFAAVNRAELGPGESPRANDASYDVPRAVAAALRTAEQVVALAPDLAVGHWLRGYVRDGYAWDVAGALLDYERALALAPGDARMRLDHASAQATIGRLPEALALALQVAEADPLLADVHRWTGVFQAASGELELAAASLHRGLEVAPDNAYLHRELAFVHLLQGRAGEALAEAGRTPQSSMRDIVLAMAHHQLGNAPASRQALAAVLEYDRLTSATAYQLAEIHAFRGEREEAFRWLETAIARHDAGVRYIRYDPHLAGLRSEPRFRALLESLKLPPYS